MEENIAKFQEKLKNWLLLERKKEYPGIQEINDFLDMELDAEQMEKVFEYLEANDIDVLQKRR